VNTFPNELGGTHPLAAWGNKFLRAAKSSSLVGGTGYKLKASTGGTVLEIGSEINKPLPFQIVRGKSWLDFMVTTGYVIIGGDPIVPTYAGDGHVFSITGAVTRFYFSLVLTPTTAIVTTSSTLPIWAVDIIPIGWVDTSTYVVASASVIYQFLNENVFSPCVV